MVLGQLVDALELNNLTLMRVLKIITSLFTLQICLKMKGKEHFNGLFHVFQSILKHYMSIN